MKYFSLGITIAILVLLFVLTMFKLVEIGLFIFGAFLTSFFYIVHAVGLDNISEFTMGKFSIKRDLRKAEKILQEIEKIKDDINEIAKLSTENSYILASESMLAMGGDKHVTERLEENLDKLIKLTGEDESWWKNVEGLFDFRKDSQQK